MKKLEKEINKIQNIINDTDNFIAEYNCETFLFLQNVNQFLLKYSQSYNDYYNSNINK